MCCVEEYLNVFRETMSEIYEKVAVWWCKKNDFIKNKYLSVTDSGFVKNKFPFGCQLNNFFFLQKSSFLSIIFDCLLISIHVNHSISVVSLSPQRTPWGNFNQSTSYIDLIMMIRKIIKFLGIQSESWNEKLIFRYDEDENNDCENVCEK